MAILIAIDVSYTSGELVHMEHQAHSRLEGQADSPRYSRLSL